MMKDVFVLVGGGEDMLKGLIFFIKFSWKNRKSYLILNIINQIFFGVLPLIIITLPKYIIDELMSGQRIDRIAIYVAILLVTIFISSWGSTHLKLKIMSERCYLSAAFGEYMHTKLVNADFCNLEDPKYYDIREKANKFLYGDWHGFSYVLESALSIVGKILTSVGIIVIISTMSIWIVLVFIAMVILGSIIDYKAKKKSHKFSVDAVRIERRWNYFTRILEDPAYSKEIRMNQIGGWLIDEEKNHAYGAIEFYKKRNACSSVSSFFNAVLNLIQNLVTYIYLISEVLHGMISIGSFTMYVSAVTSFSNAIKSVITSILDIKVYGIYYNALEQYLSIKETMRENEKRPLPDSEHYKIEFRNVSFRYPGQSTYALKNINITIGAGEKLSVVGENGSGKTTFIKLLCRLYDPTEGEILFNGINIREIDYDAYICQFAAVFQDFKLFSFSVKDNIVWGDDSDGTRTKAIKLTDDIGLGKKIGKLPRGIDTTVYKEFDANGFEPSGGEAQKIAIARAVAKDARIIILDEPLSALDPKAEYEIFKDFDKLVGNKTAVYISHRLSSCRSCDNIAVFDNGEICEFGTHDELIKKKGKYNELYSLQAQYYVV